MFARQTHPAAALAGAVAAVSVSTAPRRPVTPRGLGGASSLLRPGIAATRQAAPSTILPRAVLAVAGIGTQLSLFGPRPARR